jgi:hypothetical protein
VGFFIYAESSFFPKKERKATSNEKTKIKKNEEEKEMFKMTTKAATAIAQ